MSIGFQGHGTLPGISEVMENVEAQIFWGSTQVNHTYIVPVHLASTTVYNNGTADSTTLPPGLMLAMVASTGQVTDYDGADAGSTDNCYGFLLWDVNMLNRAGVAEEKWWGYAMVGGQIKAANTTIGGQAGPGMTAAARTVVDATGRFILDDFGAPVNI